MRRMLNAGTLLLFALVLMAAAAMPAATSAQIAVGIGVSVHVAPPPIPVAVVQPPCPTEGYLWTPGYWAYGPAGYYWVDGVWVAPPRVGLLWTPGYWGFVGGVYGWHAGYWGPHVGFYGGVNYGFGYGGVGFVGGEWRGGVFAYNTAAMHVGGGFHNVYVNRTVINNTTVVNRASFNGPGGVVRSETAEERGFDHEQHLEATHDQTAHMEAARNDPNARFANNHGRPVGMGVNAREQWQQNRVAQGERSGQMTPGEAARAEHNEAHIDNQVNRDRAANGGHLTGAEHNQVEHEQNKESHQIYNEKHNAKTDANPHPHANGGSKDEKEKK
jgi:hypothetical protein